MSCAEAETRAVPHRPSCRIVSPGTRHVGFSPKLRPNRKLGSPQAIGTLKLGILIGAAAHLYFLMAPPSPPEAKPPRHKPTSTLANLQRS